MWSWITTSGSMDFIWFGLGIKTGSVYLSIYLYIYIQVFRCCQKSRCLGSSDPPGTANSNSPWTWCWLSWLAKMASILDMFFIVMCGAPVRTVSASAKRLYKRWVVAAGTCDCVGPRQKKWGLECQVPVGPIGPVGPLAWGSKKSEKRKSLGNLKRLRRDH